MRAGRRRPSVPCVERHAHRGGRLERLRRSHPRLYAARHFAAGAGEVLLAVVGIGIVFALVPLPDISLPLPDLSLPSLPLPDARLPAWLAAVLGTAKFWLPVLVGLVATIAEMRRRRARP